jgi:peptide/nickel transport system permease protein
MASWIRGSDWAPMAEAPAKVEAGSDASAGSSASGPAKAPAWAPTQVVSADHDTLLRVAARRFVRHRLAIVGLVIIVVIVLMAIFAPFITSYSPTDLDLRSIREPPSTEHILGTDTLGFDVWSRVVYGARTSLIVGFGAVAISILIGTVLGVTAGFYGGATDQVIGRLTDTIMSLPSLLLVIVFVSIVGPSLESVVVVIALLTWPGICRLVRGQYLALRESEFVTAARVVGVRDRGIIYRHLLPNIFGPLSVAATFYMAQAILLEAALSFLGLGVKPPTPSWGNMVNLAQDAAVLQFMPWTWVPPAMAIALIVLGINFVGDGLRDALDPRSNVRRA